MIHFLYNTFEEFAFSECEPRTGVKARQTAPRPRCCPVLDKLSWTRRRAESWFMSSMCLRSLASQRVLQAWVLKTKKNLKTHKVCWWDHRAGPHQSWRPWKSGPPFLTRAVSSADLSSVPGCFFRFPPQLQIAFWWRTSQRLLEKKVQSIIATGLFYPRLYFKNFWEVQETQFYSLQRHAGLFHSSSACPAALEDERFSLLHSSGPPYREVVSLVCDSRGQASILWHLQRTINVAYIKNRAKFWPVWPQLYKACF